MAHNFSARGFPVRPIYSSRADLSLPIERRTRRTYGCLPSSAFRSPSVYLPLDWLPLADLHPVVPITVTHSATTPPPSSPPRASIFAPQIWARREWSSPVPIADVRAIRSCPLYTGCAVE